MNHTDRDFFDEMAPKWDSIITVDANKIGHILDVAQISKGESVLDVGTGTGVLIPYMLERIGQTGNLLAIDISEGMLKEARKKFQTHENVEFRLVDAESDTLPEKYDHIIMYCMYPHLTNPEETVEWLVKVNLKPGGNLVIAFPESKEGINSIHHHNDGSVHSVHLIDANMLKAKFAVRGLDVDYVEDTDEYYIVRISLS